MLATSSLYYAAGREREKGFNAKERAVQYFVGGTADLHELGRALHTYLGRSSVDHLQPALSSLWTYSLPLGGFMQVSGGGMSLDILPTKACCIDLQKAPVACHC